MDGLKTAAAGTTGDSGKTMRLTQDDRRPTADPDAGVIRQPQDPFTLLRRLLFRSLPYQGSTHDHPDCADVQPGRYDSEVGEKPTWQAGPGYDKDR